MKVGIGYSDSPDTTAAGKQAVERAICQAERTDPCDMVLLFSTAQHDQSVLLESVASVVGNTVPVYGGGTAGVITNEYYGYAGNQIGAACFWLDGVRCDVLSEGGMREGEMETGIRLGHRLAQLGTTSDSPVMLLYDAVDATEGTRLLMATPLLKGIEKGLGFYPDLTGVGMIGDIACSPAKQWIGNTISDANAIALAFSGDIQVDNVIVHGCRPATQYYTVTKASGPVILEINGKPALQFLDELLNSAVPPEQYPFFLIFGINHGDRWGEYDENNYASRLCLAIDRTSNGIVMFEPDMVEGTEFQIMYRSLEPDYIKPKIDKIFADIGDRIPVFAMFIDCAGRCAGYAGSDLEDALVVQKAVAGRVPVLGVYNGVEIAPIGGRPRSLDWTGVFCLFSQSKDGKSGGTKKAMDAAYAWQSQVITPPSKEVSLGAMVRTSEQNIAKILSLDTTSTAIRIELEQKRRGFALLAELSVSLWQNASYENVFIPVAQRVNAALNMQRTVVLEKQADGRFSAVVLQGYSAEEKAAMAGRRFDVPPELLDTDHPVLVTGADPADRLKDLRETLRLPYFVSFPVVLGGEVFAILIAGRCVESIPYLTRLSDGDGGTIQAISALLASVLSVQRLASAEESNRIMVDAMPMCCLLWDENGVLTDCNQAALSLFEFQDKEEFLQRFPTLEPEYQPDGTRSSDTENSRTMKAFVTGYHKFEFMHLTATGAELPVESTLIRVPKGEGYTVVAYLRDLRDQNAAANYARAKNEFLASISHEIRTPLNAIQSMALIADGLNNLSEEHQNLINRGIQSIGLLTSAIDSILDFSKIDSGQLALEAVEFSPQDLVEGICDMARPDAEAKSLYLRTFCDADIPDLLQGDSARLQQVLFNIIMNAVKFTEAGGIEVRIYRGNTVIGDDIPLIFEVSDSGIGICETQIAKLFSPFFAGDTAYNRRHTGLGMGLTISNGLATLMGGKITCESRLGVGSIFRVHISLSPPIDQSLTTKGRSAIIDRETLQGMKILVAEDNKINQMIMRELLISVGCETTFADNGIKALQCLKKDVFDVVLMDIQMPEMDGLTATAQIRSDPHLASLPVLAMTANVGAEHVEESLKAGMNAHLAKPVDVKKLYSALVKWGKR